MNRPTSTAKSKPPAAIKARRTLGLLKGFGRGSCFSGSCAGSSTPAALSNSTSMSTLIVSSSRIGPFHLPNRAREVGASLIEAVKRGDLVVVGAGERILGRNNLDIVGNPGFEAVAGLVDFLARQFNAEVCDLHFIAGRLQIEQGCFHIESDLVPQILLLLLDFLEFQVRLGDFGLDAAAREKRHADGGLILVRRDTVG